MSSGFGGARVNQQDTKQKEFSTINKDGKTVWEPGLPALVTSRRQHRSKQTATVVEEPPVPCDLKATLKMSAPSKTEWLEKVLKAKAKAQDVFNIVTHPKFASGVSEKYGKKMFQMVAEHMDHFSDKQRLTLSRCKLAALGLHGEVQEDSDHDEAPAPPRRSKVPRSPRGAPSPSRGPNVGSSPEKANDEDLEWEETRKRQEEEKRRIEAQKRKLKEEEEKRKAKLGAAFQFEPEEEARLARRRTDRRWSGERRWSGGLKEEHAFP
ncbi:Uncharacterized protein SCF082_LOCUS46787 [Durusdinium trenchii]|uniref:Uncharacterized protein n=1 Tax=Durusdinium trenchii TaxID=1381693 RepID=A0ABP0RHS1_9DINO